jgi:hypothetical protein
MMRLSHTKNNKYMGIFHLFSPLNILLTLVDGIGIFL